MPSRDYPSRKQLKQRSGGIMKKANDLHRLCNVKIAVVIQDGSDWYSYRSEQNWLPAIANIGGEVKLPGDYISKREADEETMRLKKIQQRTETPVSPAPQEIIESTTILQDDMALGYGGQGLMSVDDDFFELMSKDICPTFVRSILPPAVKLEGEESFKGLQNAPQYDSQALRTHPLSTLPRVPKDSSLRLMSSAQSSAHRR